MSVPIHVTDDSFEQDVIQSDLLTVVDFWGEQCPPCARIAPILEEIAAEYDGQLRITKLNVGENRATANRYRIMSIPTLLVFKGGEPVGERIVGLRPKDYIMDKIQPYL